MIETQGFVPLFGFAGSCIRMVILGDATIFPLTGLITSRVTFQSPVPNSELGNTDPFPERTCHVT